MNEPLWLVATVALGGLLGNLSKRFSDWQKAKRVGQESEMDYIIKNYRQRDVEQAERVNKLESRILDMQQHILDIEASHRVTLEENADMKLKIIRHTQENAKQATEIKQLRADNTKLQDQVEDLERRVPK